MKCTFIGLGVMGYPMARHLKHAGFDVCVYNRTASKAERWVSEYQGRYGSTPAEASKDSDFVMVCVGNDDDVRSVFYGDDGLLAQLKPGAVVIDHTTASAELAKELDEAVRANGGAFLDAPVSGGQAGAEKGIMTTMVGGEQETFDKAQQVLECYAKTRVLMGPAGSGQLAKMVNQICIANAVQGVAEGLHLARKVGLDPDKLVEAVSAGSAGSWQLVNRYRTMWDQEYEHGFAVDWMRKDLGIALNEAQRRGAALPVTALLDQFYGEVQAMGGGRWDTSSLMARLDKLAGDWKD
ncbi:oxidoreductase [Idiomarina sp. OT37-5b]|jgi:3-hydroxyisobutyrate dehydrogenase-like beta-hydroxyacid dehydrogenase|uniref:Oxidoreductase n=2 Tax=Idiomarina aquatica TaxID=1327752 RepID=A0AA94JDQ3_9GAMM|nr:NAD(P)-dependent oxidoreductase [Idiomarina sp. OT37-5b]AVJ56010.1 oxidoreductase [Idiomarina sp. OT37-5b]RUO43460.1 oxidoreductase [Idiomarina aquatica]